ncbi:hypothetical protein VZT92_021024 [Zoarces viviparus]|uniref:Uncharacterized protein n=1 Tax=Zoarces viviparus TaxID=48416 RepID=A0AAW1EHR0_ZOAVI
MGQVTWCGLTFQPLLDKSCHQSGRALSKGLGSAVLDYELLDQRDPRVKPKVIHYNRLKPYRSAWSAERKSAATFKRGCSSKQLRSLAAYSTLRLQTLCLLEPRRTKMLCASR